MSGRQSHRKIWQKVHYFGFGSFASALMKMTSTRRIVNNNNAPRPIAPYNQAVILDSTVYVSGCLGLDKDTMKLVGGDVRAEARQAFKNLGQILQAAKSSYDKVIKSTIFMSDINDFAAINEVYKECDFSQCVPSKDCGPSGEAAHGRQSGN
ncbi:rutC family protein UK114 isoform X2 [Euwallacea fornicatus]|uniref:rutC family protein UK114 isoform X2 n=1 Tax=Euwallacea fornicatus TaxID=995702 RepID=UPI00338DB76E